jgi:hypothetical protein
MSMKYENDDFDYNILSMIYVIKQCFSNWEPRSMLLVDRKKMILSKL